MLRGLSGDGGFGLGIFFLKIKGGGLVDSSMPPVIVDFGYEKVKITA
jgi:hypothetical protein